MDRRNLRVNTAQRVTKTLNCAGYTPTSVSKATGIPLSALNGTTPLWVSDLGKAGGLSHVHPAELIGASA